MSIKEFLKKTGEKIKEANKPENVKKRLEDKIEITKLKNKLEKIEAQRSKRKAKKQKKISIGIDDWGK